MKRELRQLDAAAALLRHAVAAARIAHRACGRKEPEDENKLQDKEEEIQANARADDHRIADLNSRHGRQIVSMKATIADMTEALIL